MKQNRLIVTGNAMPGKFHFFHLSQSLKLVLSLVLACLIVPVAQAQSSSETQLEREWLKQFNLPDNSYSSTHSISIGPDDMPVVVGSFRDKNYSSHIVTTKLNPSGTVVWQKEFAGLSGSSSSPYDVGMDEEGNIYIFAMVGISPGNYDLAIVKYTPDGEMAWVKEFNGGDNRNDSPVGMAVTLDGVVFVTAKSTVIGDKKTLTARFDSSGNQEWIKTFDGPIADSDPEVHSIALDAAGNPVISGSHFISGQGHKLFVVKYNSQDGQEQWVEYLNEMDAASGGHYSVNKLLTDAESNIYLAGAKARGDLTGSKLLLLKLDAQGNMLWSKLDETPSYETYLTDAEFDEQGDLVILASSQFGRSATELYLAKYSAAGEKHWGNVIEDAEGKNYYPNALTIQEGGNIAFTGFVRGTLIVEYPEYVTFLYSSTGNRIGFDKYADQASSSSGIDLSYDENGNLYVAGNGEGLLMVKYSADTVLPPPSTASYQREWVKPFEQTLPPRFMETDKEGNPLAVDNNKIMKYDTKGKLLWSGSYIGAELRFTIDGQNSVYVLSHFSGTNPQNFVTKYTADGTKAWEYSYKPAGIMFHISDFDVNKAGEVFLTGSVTGSGDKSYIRTVKVNASGTGLVWEKEYMGYSEMRPTAFGLRVNEQGDVLVVGQDVVLTDHNTTYEELKPFLLKYSGANGNLLLEKEYSRSFVAYFPQLYTLHTMGLDKSGNVYVTGHSQNQVYPGFAAFVFKLDVAGRFAWKKDVGERRLELSRSSVDENGNTVLLSSYQSLEGPRMELVTRINSNGVQTWSKTFYNEEGLGQVESSTVGNVLAVAGGLTAIGGNVQSDPDVYSTSLSFMLVNELGEVIYKDVYANQAAVDHGVRSMAADAAGNIYVGGYALAGSPVSDLLLIKYGSNGAIEEPCNIPVDVKLYLPPMAKRVGWQVRTTADFGDHILDEDPEVRWTWGDGSSPSVSYTAYGTPRITGEHTYQKGGIYTIGLDFEESCLHPNAEDYTQQMVIFDPEAGFVKGSGEFQAPGIPGNKKLKYSFSVRYPNKHSAAPVGNLYVRLGNMGNMVSKQLDWLVIGGNRAAWQGTGSIAGKGNYKFVATVMDAGGSGPNDSGDGLRVQVWDMNAYGKLVFDNHPAGDSKLDLMQSLPSIGKGQIIINGSASEKLASTNNGKLQAGEAGERAVAYPNPFTSKSTVSFLSKAEGAYQAVLFNAKGALVSTLKSGTAQADEIIEVEVDGAELEEGLYFLRLSAGNEVQSVKLLLQR